MQNVHITWQTYSTLQSSMSLAYSLLLRLVMSLLSICPLPCLLWCSASTAGCWTISDFLYLSCTPWLASPTPLLVSAWFQREHLGPLYTVSAQGQPGRIHCIVVNPTSVFGCHIGAGRRLQMSHEHLALPTWLVSVYLNHDIIATRVWP